MKEMARDRWKAMRSKGRTAYIIRHGILEWGISTGVAFIGISAIWDRLASGSWPGFELSGILIPLTMFPLAGILYGHTMWNRNETWYQKQQERAPE